MLSMCDVDDTFVSPSVSVVVKNNIHVHVQCIYMYIDIALSNNN